MTRAKFQCTRIWIEKDDRSFHYKENTTDKLDVVNVELTAVISATGENAEFFASTPNGQIRLGIMRPEAASLFVKGKEYYVDFTAAQ